MTEHETTIKKRFGRTVPFNAFLLEFTVSQSSVRTTSDAELIRALKQHDFLDLLRYNPKLAKNMIKTAIKNMKPKRRRILLRKIMKDTGAYVAQHQTTKLTLPALKEPLELLERRFPAVGPDADDD